MEKLQAQLKVMRRDVRMLQKKTAEIAKAREDAELKIKESVLYFAPDFFDHKLILS